MYCLPGKPSAEFVCCMEDVLDVYHRPYDPRRPVLCLDETCKQLVGETRQPLPVAPGCPARFHHEYVRNGVANLFMMLEPLTGQCHVRVSERRAMRDWALTVKELVDVHYPEAEMITLVVDNLSTHKKAALYETFEPAEARRIADKLDIHHTPKYGSWLNMAEIGLSILSRQCLDRRIATIQLLGRHVKAWLQQRLENPPVINWQFTTQDARIKLKRLYPSLLAS
jgi:transposase|tara:strand:- start:15 stop:689 length:675 start_codon:yes stop_codon:yes gene_type:complete